MNDSTRASLALAHEPVYVPGRCNIGTEEVTARRRGAVAGTLMAAVLGALTLLPGVPREARLVVGIPAAGAVVAALQVRNRFCVAFAARGVYNVADRLGATTGIADAGARRTDLLRALRMAFAGVVAGSVIAVALYLLP